LFDGKLLFCSAINSLLTPPRISAKIVAELRGVFVVNNASKERAKMVLRCTQKMIDTYGMLVSDNVQTDDFFSWHVNLFYVGEKECVMFVNDATRLPVALFYVKKGHFSSTIGNFTGFLGHTLEHYGASEQQIRKYLEKCVQGIIPITKTTSRSVMGCLNNMIYIADRILDDFIIDGILYTNELNILLSEYPMKILDWRFPYEVFIDRLKKM
jgi:hypothetical protein